MNDFEPYRTIGPEALLMRRISQQAPIIAPPNSFDPYQALLKRKQQGDDTKLPPVMEYDPNDLFALQQFCQTHGIVGFNMGRMNPKAALSMLKSRMGIKESPTPSPPQSKLLLG